MQKTICGVWYSCDGDIVLLKDDTYVLDTDRISVPEDATWYVMIPEVGKERIQFLQSKEIAEDLVEDEYIYFQPINKEEEK